MSSRRRRRRRTSTTFMNLFIYVSLSINFLFTSPIKVDCKMKNWNFSFPKSSAAAAPTPPLSLYPTINRESSTKIVSPTFSTFNPISVFFCASPNQPFSYLWCGLRGSWNDQSGRRVTVDPRKFYALKFQFTVLCVCPHKIFKFKNLTIIVAPKNR